MRAASTAKFSRVAQALPLVVVIVALAALVVIAVLHFKLGLISPGAFGALVVIFAVLIPAVIRRAVRRSRERGRRELEEMRGKPVLHLND